MWIHALHLIFLYELIMLCNKKRSLMDSLSTVTTGRNTHRKHTLTWAKNTTSPLPCPVLVIPMTTQLWKISLGSWKPSACIVRIFLPKMNFFSSSLNAFISTTLSVFLSKTALLLLNSEVRPRNLILFYFRALLFHVHFLGYRPSYMLAQ